jgi:hypothetical protein
MPPVRTNRPMSEYEAALFSAVLALGQTLLKAGSLDETALLERLAESRSMAEQDGRTNEAATLTMFMKLWGEPPTYYVPGPNSPDPSN